MDFLELAKKRKTTYEFSSTAVKEIDVEKILEAGRWSPSCSNSQPWHFVVINDKTLISKLISMAYYGDFHTEPPLVIAIVLRQDLCQGESHSCFTGEDSGVHDSYMSIAMSALSMILEAQYLGIDSCILTPVQKQIKKLLNVNEEDVVPLIVGFGYEKKGAFQKKRERRSLKDIVSYNSYKK
jgi:nitroreductase